ncbi:MAG: PAS domain-containing protein [Deltaproteobacteria bacterium]|nr:PAS domain-containing protein [Deltaproteobacteria bacterium]
MARVARSAAISDLGLWEWDLDRGKIWLNDRFLKALGWDPRISPIDRAAWEGRVHPDDLAASRSGITDPAEKFRDIYRVRAGDGRWRWLLSSGGVVERDSTGRPARLAGFYVDVTEIRAAQAELARRLSVATASNRMAELIISNDEPAVILKNMASIVGETLGLDRALIYDVDFVDDQARALCEWLTTEPPPVAPTPGSYPLRLFRSAVSEIARTHHWLESHVDRVSPLLAADGADRLLHGEMNIASLLWYPFAFHDGGFYLLAFNHVRRRREWQPDELELVRVVAGYVSLALMKIDILSDRQRANLALRASEERYRTLYDHTPSMFFTVARGGSVLSANRFALEHLGYAQGEVLGHSVLGVFHAEDREAAARHLESCFAEPQKTFRWELRKQCKDQRVIWVEETARVTQSAEGGPVALVVGNDVTERRRTEEAVFQAQKLESIGVLAGGVAHDFNNLLVGILGNAELARQSLPESMPARGLIDQISQAGNRAAELASRLLAYAGKGQVQMLPLDVGSVIRDMGDLLSVSAGRQIDLVLQLDPGALVVTADATQLRQVLMNLVVNASEAIGDRSGTIHLRTRAVLLDRGLAADHFPGWALAEGRYVQMEIVDDGVGISRENLARIFDPFFSTKGSGRGLGLAAVQGIVRAHRGAIRVSSVPGVGTSFEVVLPRLEAQASAQKGAKPPKALAPLEANKILIVDDDPSVRAVAAAMLKRLGFTPLEAGDGVVARQILEADGRAVGCLLLDLTMPHGGGPAVLEDLRRVRPELPVVLMSGYTELEATSVFGSQDIRAFLRKPFTLEDLEESLSVALAGG